MNSDSYSAATLDGRGRRYVHQHRDSHAGLATSGGGQHLHSSSASQQHQHGSQHHHQQQWDTVSSGYPTSHHGTSGGSAGGHSSSHHQHHQHQHHHHGSSGRHDQSSDSSGSYVRTLPHAHHHRSQGHLASESYLHHVQQTPSRLQRLDGALSIHSSSGGAYGITPSYADPYGSRQQSSQSQHHSSSSHHPQSQSQQSSRSHSQMTRSATGNAGDPYQWYKGGTLGRNTSRTMLREIPIDPPFGGAGDVHPTAVVFPYRGQGPGASGQGPSALSTHQHAALAAAAAAAARYRGTSSGLAATTRDPAYDFRAGYPIGYYAADLPSSAAAIATTPRRVSSDVYPRSPRHIRGPTAVDPTLLGAGLSAPGAAATLNNRALADLSLSHSSLLRTVSSDKGPLSVHDIAAVAAQGDKQKIAVVKPIKQQQGSSGAGGAMGAMGNDSRRNIDFHQGLGVGSGGTPHRSAASAPAQTQTSPWHQVAPQPSLASLGREMLTTTASSGQHGPITSPRVIIQTPPAGKMESIKRYIKKNTAAFFGIVEEGNQEEEDALRLWWHERRRRFAARKFGELNEAYATPGRREGEDEIDYWRRTNGGVPSRRDFADSGASPPPGNNNETLALPAPHQPIPKPRKDSIAKLTLDGLSFIASAVAKKKSREHLKSGKGPIPRACGRGWSRSFSRASIVRLQAGDDSGTSVFEWGTPSSGRANAVGGQYYPPPPAPYRSADDSIDHHSTTTTHVDAEDTEMATLDEDPFFERVLSEEIGDHGDGSEPPKRGFGKKSERTSAGGWKRDHRPEEEEGDVRPGSRSGRSSCGRLSSSTSNEATGNTSVRGVGMARMSRRALDSVYDNSDRRSHGMGVIGRYLRRRKPKRPASLIDNITLKPPPDDMDDYRPYFTHWVCIVQWLVFSLALTCYGLGPFAVSPQEQRELVRVTSLVKQAVEYFEPHNMWLGPRAADLIHLGAKFAPCMRRDERIYSQVEKQRIEEKETACCIRNDNSGCVQASRRECSWARGLGEDLDTLSTWKKWTVMEAGPGGRISGSVCGQDPNFCREPASVAPYEWPDDITKWPICRKRIGIVDRPGHAMGGTVDLKTDTYTATLAVIARELQASEHMVCEVIGKPCCIGIHGDCRITTREYCDFVHGYFHEEAALCSQVSCLDDVCGMLPFYDRESPDQFYRLWTSLFLHAGVFHLLITIVLQWWLMRDLEKAIGPVRLGIIYVTSGVAGNLASAIFVPYRAEVGPAGSLFGLFACMFVEVINIWPMLKHPNLAAYKIASIAILCLLMGLLPWVDNYANLFGFVFGFLLSYAIMPYVSFGPYDQRRKVLLIWVFLVAVCLLFAILMILFYLTPFYECEICKYLTCIPIFDDFCVDQNINFDKKPFWSI